MQLSTPQELETTVNELTKHRHCEACAGLSKPEQTGMSVQRPTVRHGAMTISRESLAD